LPLDLLKGDNGGGGVFIGNFMVYQDRIETNFSLVSFIIFEVNIVIEQ